MQDFVVYVIVSCAAIYLGRMLWNAGSGKKSGCNSCGSSCAANKPVAGNTTAGKQSTLPAPQLIQIDLHQLNGKH